METARTYLYDKSEALQEFSYDAWGNRRDPYTWTGSIAQLPMFDRGFTGHEHLFSFGLINMNGRMYDPVMSSFLSVDSYVQSPENSQNFNRYAYCLNNPLKYTDPDGEFCVLTAMAISAAVSVACQMTSNVIHEQALFKGVGRAAVTGAVQGAFSFGIGDAAAAIGKAAASAAKSEIVGKICQAGFQVVAHGTLGGYSTYARGGEFGVGFASGAVSSAISSITTGVCGAKINSKEWTVAITVAAGALSGGITAKIAGGDFWEGVCNGLISSGLNHAMHLVADGGGKYYKQFLKNHESLKAVQQRGRITSTHNIASYEKMCKYADLEIVENYLLGDEGRGQIDLSLKYPAGNQTEYDFYSSCSKGMDYSVYQLDAAVSEIASSLEQGNPVLLWEWDKSSRGITNAHSLFVYGVEGYAGADDFLLYVIDTENSLDNLRTTVKWSELSDYRSFVNFSK